MPQSISRQLALLRTATGFRLLFVAMLGSAVGTWMATIALTVDVQQRTSSSWWISAVWLATLVPTVAIGVGLGPLVDRLPRKRLLVTCDIVRLAVFAALPFVGSVTGIVVLAGVAGVANSFFRPAVLAGVPNLVPEEDLARGTSLLQTADWAATALGPVLAGAIVGAFGPHLVYWINAASFLFSAMLILRIGTTYLQSEQGITRGHWRDVREGLGEFRRSRPLLTALLALGFAVVAGGLTNVSEIFLAKVSLGSGDIGYGLLWTCSGIGLVGGSLMLGSFLERRVPLQVYAWLFLPWTIGIFAAAIAPSLGIAAAAMVVAGFGNGLAFPVTVVIVQQAAADRVRGRVFAAIISTHNTLLGLAYVAGGAFENVYGARWVYGGASALLLLGGLTAFVLTRGAAPRPVLAGQRAA